MPFPIFAGMGAAAPRIAKGCFVMPLVSEIEWDRHFGRWTYTVSKYADKGKVMLVSFDTRDLAVQSRIAMISGDDNEAVIGSEIEIMDEPSAIVRRTG